jgi:hypothetical protein
MLSAGLGAIGAANAIPLALAQLDFAGVVNAFDIHAGDTPTAVLVLAGIGGVVTAGIAVAALIGAGLALTGSTIAAPVLTACTVAGFVSATIFWVPAGVAIGLAARFAGDSHSS